MTPESIARLRENVPELRELIAYLAQAVDTCDRLDGMEDMSFTERAYEAGVRVRTKAKLTEILGPLINSPQAAGGIDPAEYTV